MRLLIDTAGLLQHARHSKEVGGLLLLLLLPWDREDGAAPRQISPVEPDDPEEDAENDDKKPPDDLHVAMRGTVLGYGTEDPDDPAGGDKVPRKGGPGVTQSDLLIVNKTDLAQAVGADLDVMARDAQKMRGDGPTVFAQVKHMVGVPEIAKLILDARDAACPAPLKKPRKL